MEGKYGFGASVQKFQGDNCWKEDQTGGDYSIIGVRGCAAITGIVATLGMRVFTFLRTPKLTFF
jgi:hypothetical protein